MVLHTKANAASLPSLRLLKLGSTPYTAHHFSCTVPGVQLPGGLNAPFKHLGIGVALAAVLAWRLLAWDLLPTVVSALLLLFVLHQRQLQPGSLGITKRRARKGRGGVWRVTLIKAEIVTDEPWSGASTSADTYLLEIADKAMHSSFGSHLRAMNACFSLSTYEL